MKKVIYIVLLIGGITLFYVGYDEYQSFGSELNRAFGGSGSVQAVWMMVGGGVATIAGLTGFSWDQSK